ncbi:MAG: hypothetical protein EPO12_03020 [Aquabacterium sp.]|nr:MAG: hypothetical protein EPO12_03020 [Aquabacterium sp.]
MSAYPRPLAAAPAGAQQAAALPWWTSPSGICLGFLLPILFLIAYVGEMNHPGLTIRGLRFLTPSYLALGVLILLVSALGGWVGQQMRLQPADASERSDWDIAAFGVGLIAFAAYAYWFKDFFLNPGLLLQTLTGAYRPDRTNIELTPGITSLANVAPAFFSIYAFRLAFGGPRIHPVAHLLCAVLVPLTIFRVYAWSERLALIEASVPFGLALGAMAWRSPRKWVRLLVLGGPFVALPGLLLYFGIAEYVRSWASPTYSGKLGFWDFAIGRMASYYYTSLNNGAGLLETMEWPTHKYEFTLFWLHRAPALGPGFSAWMDLTHSQPEEFLAKFVDPEFNNPSGLYAVICDMGIAPGIAYFALVAALSGLLFRAYSAGKLVGVLAYPVLFLSFLEIFRYPYLGQPRTFTWVLGLLLALLLVYLRQLPRMSAGARVPGVA